MGRFLESREACNTYGGYFEECGAVTYHQAFQAELSDHFDDSGS